MNQFEAGIILWIQENLRGFMDGFWIFITTLGDHGILWIALGIALLIFKKTRPIGFTVLISLFFNLIITNLTLKDLIARERPFVTNTLIRPLVDGVKYNTSFPSGHTAGSFSAMFALYRWVPKKIGIPGLVLASLIAISRLYVGVHYPTDLIGGVIIGFICSVWAYYLVRLVQKKIGEKKANGKDKKAKVG